MLGICLGMQLLYERSSELGGADGLGVLAGEVRPLDSPGLKIPQIGWNAVTWRRPSAISAGLPQPCAFYHVHSLSVVPGDEDTIVGTATYGSEFASVVAHGTVYGIQSAREVGPGRARPARRVRRPVPASSGAPRRGSQRRARSLILFPAVDIRGGRAVRLHLGHFDAETVYAYSPLEAARGWVEAGARHLHVVDLDGARSGAPERLDQLRAMTDELAVPIQYGGGLRSLEAVRDALGAGAARVVLGTAALRDERLLDAALAEAGADRIVVAVDARAGTVSVAGWTESSEILPEELVARLEQRGVTTFAYTNVDRDGTLEGPDLDGMGRVAGATGAKVIASGGVSSLGDLEALRALSLANLEGVIAGKALYERRFSVGEALAVLDATDEPDQPGRG